MRESVEAEDTRPCFNCGGRSETFHGMYVCYVCGAHCTQDEYYWYCFWTRHIKGKVSRYVVRPDGRTVFLMVRTLSEMLEALSRDPYIIAAEYQEPELRLTTPDGLKVIECVFCDEPETFNALAGEEKARIIHCMSVDLFLGRSKTEEE